MLFHSFLTLERILTPKKGDWFGHLLYQNSISSLCVTYCTLFFSADVSVFLFLLLYFLFFILPFSAISSLSLVVLHSENRQWWVTCFLLKLFYFFQQYMDFFQVFSKVVVRLGALPGTLIVLFDWAHGVLLAQSVFLFDLDMSDFTLHNLPLLHSMQW